MGNQGIIQDNQNSELDGTFFSTNNSLNSTNGNDHAMNNTKNSVRHSNKVVPLSQEKVLLDGREILVKVAYQNNGLNLLFTAWDMATNIHLVPTSTPALFCDQITDHSPVELEAMPEGFRRDKLRKIVDMLQITSNGE